MSDFDPTKLNPDDYDGEGEFVLAPPGKHICVTIQGERTDKRNKPQIDMQILPVINCSTLTPLPANTSRVFDTATLTAGAVWKFLSQCKAIGTGEIDATSDDDFREKVLGQPFCAVLVKDSYGGVERRKIQQYIPLNDAERKVFDEWKEDAALETSMPGSDPGGHPGDPGAGDDDIPF